MLPAAIATFQRFVDSRRGVAAVEFAMVMPALLLLFLGSYDAGNAIAVYMKVRSATYALAGSARVHAARERRSGRRETSDERWQRRL